MRHVNHLAPDSLVLLVFTLLVLHQLFHLLYCFGKIFFTFCRRHLRYKRPHFFVVCIRHPTSDEAGVTILSGVLELQIVSFLNVKSTNRCASAHRGRCDKIRLGWVCCKLTGCNNMVMSWQLPSNVFSWVVDDFRGSNFGKLQTWWHLIFLVEFNFVYLCGAFVFCTELNKALRRLEVFLIFLINAWIYIAVALNFLHFYGARTAFFFVCGVVAST